MRLTGLKKNLAFNKSFAERKEMIEREHPDITIKRQCELLEISRSGYYYQPKGEDIYVITIKNEIDRIHTACPFYGYRRITETLKRKGYNVNYKRIWNYMREMRIVAIYPKKNLSKRNLKHRTYPYLLRNYTVTENNEVWGIDITYIPMPRGSMYLCALIDWNARKIIAITLSNSLETEMVIRTLEKGFRRHGIPKIINSDQGSQFTSNEYIALLKEKGIKISMDGKGRATDNAITERFFRNLKQESLYLYEYETVPELKRLIDNYITFYNTERIHQSLDYWTPDEIYNLEVV